VSLDETIFSWKLDLLANGLITGLKLYWNKKMFKFSPNKI